jgi:hypothetical protein
MTQTIDAFLTTIGQEFAAMPQAQRFIAIEIASLQVSEKVFRRLYNTAVAYLAAHILTIRSRNSYGGTVSSAKEGDLALSFTGKSDHLLATTAYGQQFLQLRQQVLFSARTKVTGVRHG